MIDVSSKITKEEWLSLLQNSKFATAFQTPQMYDFYKSLSFLIPFVYGVKEDAKLEGVIVGYIQRDGGLLKRFFSKRAIIIGGPLLANTISEKALRALLQYCKKQLQHKAIYIETRNFNDYSVYKKIFEQERFFYHKHLNFKINTTTLAIVHEHLGKSRKRDIKTSLRDGAVVVTNPTLNQVKEYYNILSVLYKTKVKTPLFPSVFFEKLYTFPDARFILVMLNQQIIGGTVCIGLQNKALYEWFACGQDGMYKNIYPSTLATYSGIEYAAQNGYPIFDMMGAGKPDEGYGVREFKAKFGGELVEYGRYCYVCHSILYKIGKLMIETLRMSQKKNHRNLFR